MFHKFLKKIVFLIKFAFFDKKSYIDVKLNYLKTTKLIYSYVALVLKFF